MKVAQKTLQIYETIKIASTLNDNTEFIENKERQGYTLINSYHDYIDDVPCTILEFENDRHYF